MDVRCEQQYDSKPWLVWDTFSEHQDRSDRLSERTYEKCAYISAHGRSSSRFQNGWDMAVERKWFYTPLMQARTRWLGSCTMDTVMLIFKTLWCLLKGRWLRARTWRGKRILQVYVFNIAGNLEGMQRLALLGCDFWNACRKRIEQGAKAGTEFCRGVRYQVYSMQLPYCSHPSDFEPLCNANRATVVLGNWCGGHW